MKPIQVGLLGIGTVGSGTFDVLQRNQEEIRRRAGRGIAITMVADLDTARATRVVGDAARGRRRRARGDRQPGHRHRRRADRRHRHRARRWCSRRSPHGKHVVTANKALLAVHGTEIFAAAHAKGVMVAFEAAVAGGIPIIKALREGLTANRIEWIAGIINGTTNFILSEMRDKGLDFDDGAEGGAARCGYAEADPTFDIDGIDAAHKADDHVARSRSASRCSSTRRYVEGIAKLQARRHRATPSSSATASSCSASRARDATNGIELRVHPTLIPAQAPDRQRRRRDERGDGAGRRGRHDAVLRQGRRRRADGVGGDRRPGRHHAPAHRRPGPPRAAPRVPAGRAAPTRRSCRSSEVDDQLLPAPAGAPTRPACWRDITAHPGRSRASRSMRCCSSEPAKARTQTAAPLTHRRDHPDPRSARRRRA